MGSLQFEVTNVLFTKIKSLEPENAIKIMGYLLIQDLGENDLMRLAYGSDTLLQSLIVRAKIQLGLSSSTSSASSTPNSPSPLNPIARPNSNPFSHSSSSSSPRIPNPGSPSSSSWPLSGFPNTSISPKASSLRAGSVPLPKHKDTDLIDEHQLTDYLSFLNESSNPNPHLELGHGRPDWAAHNGGDPHLHRRSYSASDACFGSEEDGSSSSSSVAGFKPCLYFARGFCKNGGNCKFLHGGFGDSVDTAGLNVGSPTKFEGCFEQLQHEEMLRLKLAHQHRLAAAAAQFMAATGAPPSPYNKYMNFLLQQQNDPKRAAAIMMGEEFYKFGRCRPERNEFLALSSVEKATSASRQIYLTFPAESTFRDEDVSEYFSKFGPVQDVRIPYQQKRMFGFVTFVYTETVRLILSKGNPHFICESRVLVKPYKEKGKVLDKRQQQHQERGEFSPCLSPAGLDSRDPYELQLGGRMLYDTQEMLLRRKLEEQAELQQAIELQGRRLMNLQLPDFKNNHLAHHFLPHHYRSLSVGAPLPLSPQSHAQSDQHINSFDSIKQEVAEGLGDMPAASFSVSAAISEEQFEKEGNLTCINNNANDEGKEKCLDNEAHDPHARSVEQNLPDNLFASPKNTSGEHAAAEDINESVVVPENNLSTSDNSATYVASQ